VPCSGSPESASDSPYIAYECLLWNDRFAVSSNGAHTRPIFEKLKTGHTPRDAVVSVLVGLDREFDANDTPRICGLFDLISNTLWLGSVIKTAIGVLPIEVMQGQMAFVTTYGFPLPLTGQIDPAFTAGNASGACHHIMGSSIFATFKSPICSAAAMAGVAGIEVATKNVEATETSSPPDRWM
jgi:IMP cyclohydrolase